uniref:Uncharacterized protein n=1 Tax=Arundo donax TaxID=35708 RepID=A0A0A9FQE3_ARUDO
MNTSKIWVCYPNIVTLQIVPIVKIMRHHHLLHLWRLIWF